MKATLIGQSVAEKSSKTKLQRSCSGSGPRVPDSLTTGLNGDHLVAYLVCGACDRAYTETTEYISSEEAGAMLQ